MAEARTGQASGAAVNPASAAERIYIHETIEITVRHRTQFLQHFLSWGPTSRKLYNMRLVGVWAVNGSTHNWPEAIVLWELDGVDAFSKMLSGEYAHLKDPNAPVQDHYAMYWGSNVEGVTDTRGTDRLLAPTFYTPSLEQTVARKIKAAGYLHQTYTGPAGSMNDLLTKLGKTWRPIAERLGLEFVGAYKSLLLNNSEAIVIWAIPTWDHWARFELALDTDPEAIAWQAEAARLGINWVGKFLNAVAGCPIDAGKMI